MDNTIIGAIIGASSAILINGLIFLISRNNEKRREKIQVDSEIISLIYNQQRNTKRFIGKQLWLNYYQRIIFFISNTEFHPIIQNKIDQEIKLLEEIETSFIETDSRLITLSAKYRSLYPKDKYFVKSIKEINDFVITDHVSIEDFKNWTHEMFKKEGVEEKIKDHRDKILLGLRPTFFKMGNDLISYLEGKL